MYFDDSKILYSIYKKIEILFCKQINYIWNNNHVLQDDYQLQEDDLFYQAAGDAFL